MQSLRPFDASGASSGLSLSEADLYEGLFVDRGRECMAHLRLTAAAFANYLNIR
jgi:hypothetical protein